MKIIVITIIGSFILSFCSATLYLNLKSTATIKALEESAESFEVESAKEDSMPEEVAELLEEIKKKLEIEQQLYEESLEIQDEPEVITYIDYKAEGGIFDLPLSGATGFAATNVALKEEARSDSLTLTTLVGGESFSIINEEGKWWEVQVENQRGWVQYEQCLINLPDILPTIVYDNANSYKSKFQSMGRIIPNVSAVQLYDVKHYNERLQEESYSMPIAYDTSKKLAAAQELALKDGNTLILVETYRPYSVQKLVVEGMTSLMNSDYEVYQAISSWGTNWFIATGVSNHQRGTSIDLTLGKVVKTKINTSGDYQYTKISSYEEYTMPTEIHDLNPASASMAYPVKAQSDAWKTTPKGPNMNESAILMQSYCTQVGLTPLASEWWHFDDYDAKTVAQGEFLLGNISSVAPFTF